MKKDERENYFNVAPLGWSENNIIFPVGNSIKQSMVNDSRREIVHFYMTAMMVKMQYTLTPPASPSLQSSHFQFITFMPAFYPPFSSSAIYLIKAKACHWSDIMLLECQHRSCRRIICYISISAMIENILWLHFSSHMLSVCFHF